MNKFLIVIFIALICGFLPTYGQDDSSLMYNYVTEEYEEVLMDTIKNYEPYMPQIPAAINLYRIYIIEGDEPAEAAIKVFRIIIKGQAPDRKLRKKTS